MRRYKNNIIMGTNFHRGEYRGYESPYIVAFVRSGAVDKRNIRELLDRGIIYDHDGIDYEKRF